MRLRQVFEDKGKVAAFALGRLNPATNGHELLVNAIKQQPGDPFLFLTDRAPKLPDNPLTSEEKLDWARKSFDGINIGLAKTVLIAADRLYKMGYREVTFLEGEPKLLKLIQQYNGVEKELHNYNFDKINYVQLERNPEAGDATGMSGTKLRSTVVNNDLDAFKAGVTKQAQPHAEEMFKKLQGILGVDAVEENINEFVGPAIQIGMQGLKAAAPHAMKSLKWIGRWIKANPKKTIGIATLPITGPILTALASTIAFVIKVGIPIAVGLIALKGGVKLWKELSDKDPKSVTKEELDAILQKYQVKGEDDEVLAQVKRDLEAAIGNESIEEIMAFGIKGKQKRATIKRKPEKFEPSTAEKVKIRRQAFAKGDKNAFSKDWKPQGGW